MSLYRVGLVAITALFTAGMTSIASAGCCDWGGSSSAAYASPLLYAGSSGCGGCGTTAYAAPIAYARPITYAAPITYASGCGGCGGCASCGSALVYAQPTVIAPAPIYVVNQGPNYVGPGFMVPYKTYSAAAYAATAYDYPYLGAPRPHYYHHAYRAPRVVYRDRVIYRDRVVPVWRPTYRHPIHPRG